MRGLNLAPGACRGYVDAPVRAPLPLNGALPPVILHMLRVGVTDGNPPNGGSPSARIRHPNAGYVTVFHGGDAP